MGLIGTLFKGVGKIAKGVASKLTYGASDHVIKAVRSLGTAKKSLQRGRAQTMQMQALLNRQMVPRVRQTQVLRAAQAGAGQPGTYGAVSRPKRRRPRVQVDAMAPTWDDVEPAPRPRRRRRTTKRAKKSAARSPARRSPRRRASTGTRRRPPPGGMDLKAMSAAWRAAGKPTSWQDWIKNNQIRRS